MHESRLVPDYSGREFLRAFSWAFEKSKLGKGPHTPLTEARLQALKKKTKPYKVAEQRDSVGIAEHSVHNHNIEGFHPCATQARQAICFDHDSIALLPSELTYFRGGAQVILDTKNFYGPLLFVSERQCGGRHSVAVERPCGKTARSWLMGIVIIVSGLAAGAPGCITALHLGLFPRTLFQQQARIPVA